MADETTDKSEADETTDDQVEATADETTDETAEAADTAADDAADEQPVEESSDESKTESEAEEGAEGDASEESGEDDDEKSEKSDDKSDKDDDEDEFGGISMKQVEAILSHNADAAKEADVNVTPQMRRMFDRELENTKRVEETIKGAKSNPAWFVPLFVALLIIGLIWVVAFYFTGKYPIPQIGQWNLLVGFGIMLVGFLMTMWWH